MWRKILILGSIVVGAAQPALAADTVDPGAEFKAFRAYFTSRFPKVPLDDFVNGPYSMDEGLRKQWKAIEEFPPYEFAVDKGKQMFATPFKSGKTYGDCFPNKGIGVRQMYPMFDARSGKVITLEVAVNQCREANGEKPLDYTKDDMAAVTAYMAFTSRGKPFDIKIPDDPRALAAYNKGREYFYTRRGQLNFSCASCHVQSAGDHIRAEVLAPAFGITAALPIYRSAWGRDGNDDPPSAHLQRTGARRAAAGRRRTLSRRRILPLLHGQRPADLRAGHASVIEMNRGGTPMRTRVLIRLAVILSVGGFATVALAASADDFKAAYAKAEAASKQAHALKNEWTTTTAALKAAKAAGGAGKFDDAVKHAQEAEALADASIAQAKEQEKLWPEAVVR